MELVTTALMLFWFFALRNTVLLPIYPTHVLPIPLPSPFNPMKDSTYQELIASRIYHFNKWIMEIEGYPLKNYAIGSQNTKGLEPLYTYGNIQSAKFASDASLTIMVITSCIILSSSITSKFLKALSPGFLVSLFEKITENMYNVLILFFSDLYCHFSHRKNEAFGPDARRLLSILVSRGESNNRSDEFARCRECISASM
jgi:hypothetical protein